MKMLKKKLLIGLIFAGCFSGYASAAAGPTLSKTLPVNLAQETTLSVDWAPVTNLYTNQPNTQIGVGQLSISSSGLSSVTVKSTAPADLTRSGRYSFYGPNDSYMITALDFIKANNVTSREVPGGIVFSPTTGTSTLPDNFQFGLVVKTYNAPGHMQAGVYTANITVDSVIA